MNEQDKILECKILHLFDEMQDEIDWGGSEDEEGTLCAGIPDIDDYKDKVREIFKNSIRIL